jgi:hypothetical protein
MRHSRVPRKRLLRWRATTEWTRAYARRSFSKLIQPQCDAVAKPAWWNDEALLSLSAAWVAHVAPTLPPESHRVVSPCSERGEPPGRGLRGLA